MYSVRQKVSPKAFAIFLAAAGNFDLKFYTFIVHSYIHKNANGRFVIFDFAKVIECFE